MNVQAKSNERAERAVVRFESQTALIHTHLPPHHHHTHALTHAHRQATTQPRSTLLRARTKTVFVFTWLFVAAELLRAFPLRKIIDYTPARKKSNLKKIATTHSPRAGGFSSASPPASRQGQCLCVRVCVCNPR